MSRMPSVPTIQLEGPQMMERPSVVEPYQETPVIFPKPNVALGPGFDWGAIAEGGARLGLEFVESWNQLTFNRKAQALKSLEDKTQMIVDKNIEVNDFDAVNITLEEHEQAVADLLGFNPYMEEPTNNMAFKFASKAKDFRSSMDMATTKAKRGWTDTIAVDNYIKFSQSQQRTIADAPDKLSATNQAIETQKKMYQDLSGGLEPGTPLKEKGFTVEQRKLLSQIEKDYTDLVEQKDKLEGKGQGPQLEVTSERATAQLRLAGSAIDEATKLYEEADKVRQSGVSGAEAMASGIEARANSLANVGFRTYAQARSFMVEAYKSDVRNQVGGPVEFTELDDPLSMETLTILFETGLVPGETVTALLNAEEKLNALSTKPISRSFALQREIYKQQGAYAKARVDASTGETETTLKALDIAIKEAKDNNDTATADLLIQRKSSVLLNLRRTILENNILPFLKNDEFVSKALARTFVPNPSSTVSVNNTVNRFLDTLDFTADSLALIQELEGLNSGVISETYSHAIDKLNTLEKSYLDTPKGDSSTAARNAAQKELDLKREALRWIVGEELQRGKPAPSDQRQMGLTLAQLRLSQDGTFPVPVDPTKVLPSVDEAIALAKNNKGNKEFLGDSIPFTMEALMLTPWYGEILENAGKLPLEDAKKYMQDAFESLTTDAGRGIKFDDLERVRVSMATGTPAQDMVESYIKDPTKNPDVTAIAFLMMPKNIRDNTIASLKNPSVSQSPDIQNRILYFESINNTYLEQQSPIEFIREGTLLNPAQIRVARAMEEGLLAYRKQLKTDRKGYPPENPEIPAFKTAYDKAFTTVISGLRIPGYSYTADFSTNRLQELDELFRPMIVEALVKDGLDLTTGKIDTTKAESATGRLLETLNEVWSKGRRWDNIQGTFVQTTAEQVETPLGPVIGISKGIVSGAGMEVPEGERPHIVGLSSNFKYIPKATKDQQALYLGQVGSLDRLNPNDYDAFTKADPFTGLIQFGVMANQSISKTRLAQLGTDQVANLDRLIKGGVGQLPQDNFTVMSVMGAIALLDPNETNIEKAVSAVETTAASIRNALVSKDTSRFSMEVRETTSNQVSSQRAATIVVKSGETIIARFQPNTYSVSPISPSKDLVQPALKMSDEQVKTEYVFNPKLSTQTKDDYATQILLNSDKTQISSDEYTIGRGMAERDVYVKETNPDGTIRILKGKQWKMFGDRFNWQWVESEPRIAPFPSGVKYGGRGNERQKKAMAILLPGYFFGAAEEFKFENIPAEGPRAIYTSKPSRSTEPNLLIEPLAGILPQMQEPMVLRQPEEEPFNMFSDVDFQSWFNNVVSSIEKLGIEESKAKQVAETLVEVTVQSNMLRSEQPKQTPFMSGTDLMFSLSSPTKDTAKEKQIQDRWFETLLKGEAEGTLNPTMEKALEDLRRQRGIELPIKTSKKKIEIPLVDFRDGRRYPEETLLDLWQQRGTELEELYPRSKAYTGKPKKGEKVVLVHHTGEPLVLEETREKINPYEYYNLFEYYRRADARQEDVRRIGEQYQYLRNTQAKEMTPEIAEAIKKLKKK